MGADDPQNSPPGDAESPEQSSADDSQSQDSPQEPSADSGESLAAPEEAPADDGQSQDSPQEPSADSGESSAAPEEAPADDGQSQDSPQESSAESGESPAAPDEAPADDGESQESPEEPSADSGESPAAPGDPTAFGGSSPATTDQPDGSGSSQPDPQDASNLDAASKDAGDNFSPQPVGETVAPCPGPEATPLDSPPTAPGVSPPPPPVPGNLEVTVTDSKTKQPISGAKVTATGPEPQSGTTDGSGVVKFSGIKTGDYTIKAAATGHTTENGSATVKPADTAKAPIPLTPITVTLTLEQPVACPGHPLKITATGDPAGGTFAWTVTGDPSIALVDTSGAAASTGPSVNLRGFSTDTGTGTISALTAHVKVVYTFTNGETATAEQDVKIHEIKFVVTNKAITKGSTEAIESGTDLTLWTTGAATMSADPKVEIQLDASCPRKVDCAANHRVGWLQTVLTNVRDARYTHTLVSTTVPLPIRDVWNATVTPFYSTVTAFTGDKDKQTAHHEDSPSQGAPWTDPRAGVGATPPPPPPPPQNLQLRSVNFSDSFTAWLVVQNVEWSSHHLADSFAFQGNFDWSMELNVTVDTSKAVGSRAAPKKKQATMPASIAAGKGGGTPNLAAAFANTSAVVNTNPAPGI